MSQSCSIKNFPKQPCPKQSKDHRPKKREQELHRRYSKHQTKNDGLGVLVSWQMTLWDVFFGSKHVSMWDKHVSKLGFTLGDTWANTRSSKNDFKDIGNLQPPSLFSVSASSHAHQKLRFIFQSKWPSTNQRTKSSAVNICVKQTLVMYQPILGFCQRKLQQCRWGEQAHRGATKTTTNADKTEEEEDGKDRHGHRHQLQSGTGQPGPSRQPLHQPTRL